MESIVPVIDLQLLQEKANQAAMKGAEKAIDEFYNSYDSPYKKAIRESLEGKGLTGSFDIPDIVATLNDAFVKEVDEIANTAVAKSFVPMVKKFMTRAEKDIKFSEILKEFIEHADYEDRYDLSVEVEKHERYDWYEVNITDKKRTYNLTLHEAWDSRKDTVKKYQLLGLPYDEMTYGKTMKLSVDNGAVLELPFRSDILSDRFISYLANLVISKSQITIDFTDFEDDMFPEHECHC